MELETKIREVFGKKTNALRKEGFVPAEVYGHGTENLHVAVSEKTFMKVFREAGENTVITLTVGGEKISALIADVSWNHISRRPLAVDFHKISKDEKIRVDVPIALHGEDKAKDAGFDLVQTLSEIEIETLPAHIPHEFAIDISGLVELGQSVAVKDLQVKKEVKVLTPPETVIIAVAEKRKAEEVPAPVATEGTAAETPEATAKETPAKGGKEEKK